MSTINWYPGHMRAALNMMRENIGCSDAVIYVLDSRAPSSCLNPDLDELVQSKPIIYALNKADLADTSLLKLWTAKLSGSNSAALTLNGTALNETKKISSLIENLCKKRVENLRAKGLNAVLRAMVLGVPNSGKSTIINSLSKKAKLVTANRPGVTRVKQWIRITDNLELLDTPGTLYPKLDDMEKALRLCYIGSVKDDVVDTVDVAAQLVKELDAMNPDILNNRYKLSRSENQDILHGIAISRGFKISGGEADILRAANALLDDFRKGRLGRITLEKP